MSAENYKAVVILVYNSSKSAGVQIKDLIRRTISSDYLMELEPDVWAVSGTADNPAMTAQRQLEERYPKSTVAVLAKRDDDLSTKCKYIINPEKTKQFIYLCHVDPDDGFEPVYNDNIYYINLFYEMNPAQMEKTFGLAAQDIIEKHRRISEKFDTGEILAESYNRSDYVISPIFKSTEVHVDIGNGVSQSYPNPDKYFVQKILFDVFNGCTQCADVIRSMLFKTYDNR